MITARALVWMSALVIANAGCGGAEVAPARQVFPAASPPPPPPPVAATPAPPKAAAQAFADADPNSRFAIRDGAAFTPPRGCCVARRLACAMDRRRERAHVLRARFAADYASPDALAHIGVAAVRPPGRIAPTEDAVANSRSSFFCHRTHASSTGEQRLYYLHGREGAWPRRRLSLPASPSWAGAARGRRHRYGPFGA
jgi:hypothetical protein